MFSDRTKGFLWVSGGVIMHLYLGCFYLWGNIQVYITSYLHKHDPSVTLEDTSIVFVIQTIAQAVWMPIAPLMIQHFPPWISCLIGGIIAIGGVFGSSFVTNFWIFIFLYPILFGIGIGASYMAPVIWGWEYFPKWKGAVSGVIVAGFGFGSFIFGFISIAIANPEGQKPDLDVDGGKIFGPETSVASNAPRMIRINCAIWACLLFISLFMINKKSKTSTPYTLLSTPSNHQEDINETGDLALTQTMRRESGKREENEIQIVEPTLWEVFKDYRLYYIWLMILLSSSYPYFIASNFKTYEQNYLHDDRFITLVGSLGAVTNGLSRGFWATLQDLFGFKIVFMWLLVLEIVVAFTFVAIHNSKALYLIWVLISFSTLGGHFSTIPTLWAKMFGPNTGGKAFSFVFTGFAGATLLGWGLSKLRSQDKIKYDALFYILGSLGVLALIMVFFLRDYSKVRTTTISFKNGKKFYANDEIKELLS